MKIHNDESIKQVNSFVKSAEEKSAPSRKPAPAEPEGDHVQLSARARELQRIKDVVAEVPECRDEKVAELREAVQKGTYRSDPDKTAEKLVTESLIDLLL